jgi:hypothetical protein
MPDIKETLEAARGQKVSEVRVDPSIPKKPHKIKTEAETVRELKGEDPITISTEVDPNFAETTAEDEDETDDSDEPPDKTT